MAAEQLTPVDSMDVLQGLLDGEPGVLVYFSTPSCQVCKALRPKVADLLVTEFPRMRSLYVDCTRAPDIAARFSVFAVPTLVVFLEGREWIRKGRSFAIAELRAELARPYGLLFGDPGR
jgi:thiol-disulfide isomerase/thioredoxin